MQRIQNGWINSIKPVSVHPLILAINNLSHLQQNNISYNDIMQSIVTVKGKTDTNSDPFQEVNRSLSVRYPFERQKKSVQSVQQPVRTVCISVRTVLTSVRTVLTSVRS